MRSAASRKISGSGLPRGTSAATMLLLLQARAEGLGACWMAGPTVARRDIAELIGIREPWRMLGAVALGWPDEAPNATPRRALEKIATWFEGGSK